MIPPSPASAERPPVAMAAERSALAAVLLALALIVPVANTGAYIAMVAALLALVLLAVSARSFPIGPAPFPVLFLGAFLLIALATLLGANSASDTIFIFDFLPLPMAAGLYWILVALPRERLVRLMSLAALAGAGLGLLVGLYEVAVAGNERADGFGGSAIYFGNLSMMLGFLAIAPWLSGDKGKWYLAAGPVMGLCAAVLSASRSIVLIGIALSCVLAVHLLIARPARLSGPRLAGLLLALVLAGAVGLGLSGTAERILVPFSSFIEFVRTGTTEDLSLLMRMDFYQGGLRAFLDAPWFGHGWRWTFEASSGYMAFGAVDRQPGDFGHLHNDLLNFAVAFGVLGVLAYLALMLAPLAGLLNGKPDRVGSYMGLATVAAFAVSGLTDVNFIYEAPKVMFCFVAAASAAVVSARR